MMMTIAATIHTVMDMTMNNISNAAIELNTNEHVHEIIYLVKHRNDYANAAKVMIANDLSIEGLKNRTFKLSQYELAKLTDSIIESKK